MREKRSIGIDLHRRNFTCCMRLENGRNYLSRSFHKFGHVFSVHAAAESILLSSCIRSRRVNFHSKGLAIDS
jgi:hypothetical protein